MNGRAIGYLWIGAFVAAAAFVLAAVIAQSDVFAWLGAFSLLALIGATFASNPDTKVIWRGRELQNPFARTAVATIGSIAALTGVFVAIFAPLAMIVVLVFSLPFAVPGHVFLRFLGRRGFFVDTGDGGVSYLLDRGAFRCL